MSKLTPEEKKLQKAINKAMEDDDFFDTILEAAQHKRIEQLQAEIAELKKALSQKTRESRRPIKTKHFCRH